MLRQYRPACLIHILEEWNIIIACSFFNHEFFIGGVQFFIKPLTNSIISLMPTLGYILM